MVEMSFLQMTGLSRKRKVGSSIIWRELGVESLLFLIKDSQLRCFWDLIKMLPGCLPTVGSPREDPEHIRGIIHGLEKPLDPPGGAGEGCLGFSPGPVPSET